MPNIAVGDILGSCVFNLVLVVILDFFHRGESVYTKASQGHILSAAFGAVLIGFVGFNLLLGGRMDHLAIGHVGIYSPIIVLMYVLAMRTVFHYERRQLAQRIEETVEQYPQITLRQRRHGLWRWRPWWWWRRAPGCRSSAPIWRRSWAGTRPSSAPCSSPSPPRCRNWW
ncbi:MAG: hypothetical protein MZW92_80300 [Comamonadaceae bacterium]|nr:hypothetical protein [Comamonadaceae bacterium]